MAQEALIPLADDVAATKRVLNLQQGPALLVGHSYGGAVITEAGNAPNVVDNIQSPTICYRARLTVSFGG